MQPQPFRLHVPDTAIGELRERLARTRFPDQAPGAAWAYGTDLAWMRGLVTYWHERFDWRAAEARLNAFPQYRVPVAGSTFTTCTCPGSARHRCRCCSRTAGPARCSSSWN